MDSRISRSLVFALGLATAGCASASLSSCPLDPVTASSELAESTSLPPEDLRPWSPSALDDGYDEFVRRVLLRTDRRPAATFVCRPSFRDKFAVLLIPPALDSDSPDAAAVPNEPWNLLVPTARILSTGPKGDEWPEWRRRDPTEIPVELRSAHIEASLA